MIEAKWKREVSKSRRKALREAMENPSSGLRLLGGYPLPPFSEHFLLTIKPSGFVGYIRTKKGKESMCGTTKKELPENGPSTMNRKPGKEKKAWGSAVMRALL